MTKRRVRLSIASVGASILQRGQSAMLSGKSLKLLPPDVPFKAKMHRIRLLASLSVCFFVRLSVCVLDGVWHWRNGNLKIIMLVLAAVRACTVCRPV